MSKSDERGTTVIFNPAAGAGQAGRRRLLLERSFESWSPLPGIVETERPGHATELAREAASRGDGMVIAAGGDGTAHEAIQGLLDHEGAFGAGETSTPKDGAGSGEVSDLPLFAYLPLGTGCDFAIALNLTRDIAKLVEQLQHGEDVRIDVGVAELSGPEGPTTRYFINAANIGLGPQVADHVRRSLWLRRWGKLAYVFATLIALPGARPRRLIWRTDEGLEGDRPVFHLSACNGPTFGGGLSPCPDATLKSGRLHVAMGCDLSRLEVIRQMPRLMRGAQLDHPEIFSFDCLSLELRGADIRVETDGEVGGGLPARLSVRPGGLVVRVPRPTPARSSES
jgi:diacylglycerol kinase (ATP)